MNVCIDRMRRIESEYLDDFELKETLSEVELYGLEHILIKLLSESYLDLGRNDISFVSNLIDNYTVHRENHLDILDGCDNVLLGIGDYNIISVYLTKNGIVMFQCVECDKDCRILDNSNYWVSLC